MARSHEADARLMTRLRDANPAGPGELDRRAEADLASILASRTGTVPSPRRRPVLLAAVTSAAVLAVGGVVITTQRSGDGGNGGSPFAAADAPISTASSPPTLGPAPTADRLLSALGPQPAYDYPPAEAPTDLASDADLVAVGTLVALAPQGEGTECDRNSDEPPATTGVVMRLDHLEVAKGEPSMFTTLVVVPLTSDQGLRTAFPMGTRVLVYAVDGSSADCQPVYRVRSPQGFAVQAADGQVVWPLIRQVRDGDLSQALPNGALIAP